MNDLELMSYIINSDPTLSAEIDLPVQGQNLIEIGKLISSNNRYKNAFINTVNLIGATIIKDNKIENPWGDFTVRGTLRYGQQVRELILDLVKANDYNENKDNNTRFLETEIPNVLNYIHELNFQKFYETTTDDITLSMAFEKEGNLYDFITKIVSKLVHSYNYDMYVINKYMLCKRIVDGTIPVIEITDFDTKTVRERVSVIKGVSNKMTFPKPNYNPAGIITQTPFENQIALISTDFDAQITTEVLATSFFKNEAEMKTQMRLIDGFGDHDTKRLESTLKEQYVPFTETEIETLNKVPAVIIAKEFFMDYIYALDNQADSPTKMTNFYNPTTLKNNHYLHAWVVFSTSPFENCAVFSLVKPSVTSVALTPSTATTVAGQNIQLSAIVETVGFANKAVKYEITAGDGVIVTADGLVKIPSDFAEESITVKATSIYDETKTGTSLITVLPFSR